MAKELDPLKLSSPRIFLFRMLVFVVLGGLVAFLLHKQIEVAFMANPGLNALIIGVLLIGIVLSARQVIRLYPEIAWVNNFRLADPGLAVERPLVLGFLDLQSSQAQNRFYTELEDWLSTTVYDQAAEPIVAGGGTGEMRSAIDRLREAVDQAGTSKGASTAMSNLAEAIQGLVHHMRSEQQMIRDWVDSQAEQQREIKKLLEVMVREKVDR